MIFFFNDTATTEIYTLSLHDALPIWRRGHQAQEVDRPHREDGKVHNDEGDQRAGDPGRGDRRDGVAGPEQAVDDPGLAADRKSTRLNSSHANISYAVFCLKKKKRVRK